MAFPWRRRTTVPQPPPRQRSAEEVRAAAALDGAKRSITEFAARVAEELAERVAHEAAQPKPRPRRRRTIPITPITPPQRKAPDTFPILHHERLSPREPLARENFTSLHPFTQRSVLEANGFTPIDAERARRLLDNAPRTLAANVRDEILRRAKAHS